VVIDPLAVRGERWFLGRIFYYPHGGAYFGVPLSNFLGWWLVGAAGVLLYGLAGGAAGRRPGGGVALYYAVLAFNLVVTAWIGEWLLAAVGLALHALLALSLWGMASRRGAAATVTRREMERV
jgi:putative membrane protein